MSAISINILIVRRFIVYELSPLYAMKTRLTLCDNIHISTWPNVLCRPTRKPHLSTARQCRSAPGVRVPLCADKHTQRRRVFATTYNIMSYHEYFKTPETLSVSHCFSRYNISEVTVNQLVFLRQIARKIATVTPPR